MLRVVALLGLVMALAATCGGAGNVFDLAEGDCFNYKESEVITDVNFVECDEPHQREVFAVVSFDVAPGLPFPGSSRVGDVGRPSAWSASTSSWRNPTSTRCSTSKRSCQPRNPGKTWTTEKSFACCMISKSSTWKGPCRAAGDNWLVTFTGSIRRCRWSTNLAASRWPATPACCKWPSSAWSVP